MTLAAGTHLGSYEILAPLGAGGMGEVYRAKDTKLGREVAIKVLPEGFSDEPERMARFEREAKVLASLNHNNIATLYGFESEGDTQFLVMEVVEGETLAERIKRGAIPVDEALPIFLQIAEGLEAAHEKGVIHRDLKPANIKVTDEGNVKILDFGLAKAMAPEMDTGEAGGLSESPTLTLAATRRGEILGTAAYMSPEQAKGKAVDKRADIWAFGACLYEALTGNRAFQGGDAPDTLAAVLRAELDWDNLASTPREIQRLLRRCLKREPSERLHDIADARIQIVEALAAPEGDEQTPGAVVEEKRTNVPLVLAACAAVGLIAGIAAWTLKPDIDPPRPVLRAVLSASPSREVRVSVGTTDLTITPDGERIIYSVQGDAGSGLYVRLVDQLEGTLLGRLDDVNAPFVSPDGAWVGFRDFSDRSLKKISILGGPPVTLCELPIPGFLQGASWGTDESIIFAAIGSTGLLRVAAAGGEPESLTTPDPEKGETLHSWPHVLPGGKAVLFTITKGLEFEIAVLSLDTGEIRTLLPGGSGPRYASTGHLVYGIDGTLRAVPFDLDRLQVTGDPVPVLEGVVTKEATGAVNFTFSRNGRLVYVSGDTTGGALRSLVWVDREGREEAIKADRRGYEQIRISPDGEKVALAIDDEETDIWILDLSVGTLSRLTFAAEQDENPVWTPDGKRILFASHAPRSDSEGIYSKAASGAGSVNRLTEDQRGQFPTSISPDGARLVYRQNQGAGGSPDLFVLSLEGESRAEPLLATEFSETNGEISPNGRWLAYTSNESGNAEIYVRPFPNVDDGRWQISTGLGFHPVWSPAGRELFYRAGPEVWVVPVETEEDFRHETPELLFRGEGLFFRNAGRTYDVSPDGERFLMIKQGATTEEGSQPNDVVIVENWFEELKRLVPTD